MLHPRNRITRQRFASKHSRLSYSNRTVLIDLEMSKFPTLSPLPPSLVSSKFAIKCFSLLQWKKNRWNPSIFQTIVFYASLSFQVYANNLNWMEKGDWKKFERIVIWWSLSKFMVREFLGGCIKLVQIWKYW